MRVVGLDPAFANFGMVAADLRLSGAPGARVTPVAMSLVQTKGEGKDRVGFKSSENLARFREIHKALSAFLQTHRPELVFAEVPSGAQNANAAMALGGAVGILASIQQPIIEVSPLEVKRLFTQKQEAVPKAVIRAWAYERWPEAQWIIHGGKRTLKNEHLADALATIEAGLQTPTFQQLMALMSRMPAQRVRIRK